MSKNKTKSRTLQRGIKPRRKDLFYSHSSPPQAPNNPLDFTGQAAGYSGLKDLYDKVRDKQILGLLKAISDDTRLNIILFLISGEKCVCEIYKHLKLPQNLVSHHLRILRDNCLIKTHKEGKWVYYSLNKETPRQILKFLEMILITEKRNINVNFL